VPRPRRGDRNRERRGPSDATSDEGTAALIVDKEVRALLELGDRHLIMVKGRIVFAGTSAQWRARAEENLALLRA
jgi:ABC-type branched-subunit amino acid transport system ATPase component